MDVVGFIYKNVNRSNAVIRKKELIAIAFQIVLTCHN